MGITSSMRPLLLSQIEAVLSRWRSANLPPAPGDGWARPIREALGMTGVAFAQRLGVSRGGARKLEQSEADGTITLASLRKMAEALDCDLKYALVPRKPLDQMIIDRAREVASADVAPVLHTMALENQATSPRAREKLRDSVVTALLTEGSLRKLW